MLTADARCVAGIPRAMERDIGPRRIADVLHDVHLAGVGPTPCAERPERRPEPGAGGRCRPRRGGAIRELKFRSRVEAAGDEVEGTPFTCFEARPVARADDQGAVL